MDDFFCSSCLKSKPIKELSSLIGRFKRKQCIQCKAKTKDLILREKTIAAAKAKNNRNTKLLQNNVDEYIKRTIRGI